MGALGIAQLMKDDGTGGGDYMDDLDPQGANPDVPSAGLSAGSVPQDAPQIASPMRTAQMEQADAHLQQVIQALIEKQQQPTRAEAYAILGGGTPGMRQSFGESMMGGLAKAASLVETRENNLDNLRLKAAELESNTATKQALAIRQAELAQQRRGDYLARAGLVLDENGVRVVDPTLLNAAAQRAGAIEAAKTNAKNPMGNVDFNNIINNPITPSNNPPPELTPAPSKPVDAPKNPGDTVTKIAPLSANSTLISNDDPIVKATDERLARLAEGTSPAFANVVKTLIDGRMNINSLPRDKREAYIQAATTVDPTFDASDANTRAKARQSLTSGKDYQTLQALNTVAGHLNHFADAAAALNNSSGFPGATTFNAMTNKWIDSSGDERVKNFNLTRSAVSDELSKAYKGGVISDTEKKEWSENLDAASSPEQFQGAVKTMATLLESRINALVEAAKTNMGPGGRDIQFVAPEAQKLFDKLEGKHPAGDKPIAPKEAEKLPTFKSPSDPEFKKLPKGSKFIDSEGQVRTKK